MSREYDVLVVGSGAAGLTAALNLAERCKVGVIAKAQDKSVVVTFDRDVAQVPTNACFENIGLIDERTLEITYRKDRVNAGQVLAAVQEDGFGIVDVTTKDPDLESVFLSLTAANREEA